ncbi:MULTISPECIES: LacI family DNA-binding transcriptional regulator [Asticcacaulis]|uniref:LacI family DNA-binding transcriptional regulator n=1 Tax=Asticcacaulis TaxID=76890 RepID=UPI001FDA6645|nr:MULTISPECIES: LacI family DNA-binding transcriptional regulator [Asticcacaulis]MBP2157893.1 LacI family transcriptional regulator [Asticcacaulis solisilvae]MDR6798938.1 LacI family transcriptional regulator [Asticcacaulis sp. BE141]
MKNKVAPDQGGNITIHDVARHAGVSSMTVSRVINQNVNVREPLRERVLASIKALNYSINVAAQSTRAGVGGVRIGILYSHPSASYLNEIMLGGLEHASKLGAQLILEKCGGLQSQKNAVNRLVEAGVDGVILPPPLCDSEPTVQMLKRAGISVLALATARPLPDVSAVRIDDFQGALALTRHLVHLGHRRIGFIKGDPSHTPTDVRYKGFLAGLLEAGLPLAEDLVLQGQFTYKSGLEVGRDLLDRDDRPTAIFASNDDMAAAVLAVAHGMGISIPDELSVCGFDDTPVATTVWPQLTTVHQPIVAMGRSAVGTIHDKIRELKQGEDSRPTHQLMKFMLMHRGSTGPAPDKRL